MFSPKALLVRALILLTLASKVIGRRGGGGDHDSDSNNSDTSSDSGGTSTSGGSSTTNCGAEQHRYLYGDDLIPLNVQNWTSEGGSVDGANPTTYDGSFFQGEASLAYNITGTSRCGDVAGKLRLLGYAWVGPVTPYPTGPTNPFIIGFKAWESDKSVEDITDSYEWLNWGKSCTSKPDLVRVITSLAWPASEGRGVREAADVMRIRTEGHAASDRVELNATSVDGLDIPKYRNEGLVRLPGRVCQSDELSLDWPQGTRMNGSITNTTLDLRLVGKGNTSTDYKYSSSKDEIHIAFELTFSGTFDGVNSTMALDIQPQNETMVKWVKNGAERMKMSWAWVVGIFLVFFYAL